MTRTNLETAINEGIPFAVHMADGRSYTVRDRLKIAMGKTSVIVIDEKDAPHILPMLTMSGISYLEHDKPEDN